MSLSVDANVSNSVDLFGKTVNDLQSAITVTNNSISGILNYVDDYTGFSGNVEEQEGNYLVIHAEVPDVEGATITVTLSKSTVLDEDGIIVLRVTDKSPRTLTVVASADGFDEVTKTFDISGLVLD